MSAFEDVKGQGWQPQPLTPLPGERAETVRRVAAALWADDYEGWERLNKQAQAHAEQVARALEATARCEHTMLTNTRGYGNSWVMYPPADCPTCHGTGIDPARLEAGLKELEGKP